MFNPEEEEQVDTKLKNSKSNFSSSVLDRISNIAPLVVIFFLIIVANNAGALFSCELRMVLAENMVIKHLMGILIIYVFVVVDQDNLTPLNHVFLTFFIYFWFMFIMRSRLVFVITSLVLLFCVFLLSGYQKYLENQIEDDDLTEKIDMAKKGGIIASIIISIIGFVRFVLETRLILGDRWTFKGFWLGLSEEKCREISNKRINNVVRRSFNPKNATEKIQLSKIK